MSQFIELLVQIVTTDVLYFSGALIITDDQRRYALAGGSSHFWVQIDAPLSVQVRDTCGVAGADERKLRHVQYPRCQSATCGVVKASSYRAGCTCMFERL